MGREAFEVLAATRRRRSRRLRAGPGTEVRPADGCCPVVSSPWPAVTGCSPGCRRHCQPNVQDCMALTKRADGCLARLATGAALVRLPQPALLMGRHCHFGMPTELACGLGCRKRRRKRRERTHTMGGGPCRMSSSSSRQSLSRRSPLCRGGVAGRPSTIVAVAADAAAAAAHAAGDRRPTPACSVPAWTRSGMMSWLRSWGSRRVTAAAGRKRRTATGGADVQRRRGASPAVR